MNKINKGDLFEVSVQVIRVVNLAKEDTEAEYLILLKFSAVSISDEIMRLGIKGVFSSSPIVKVHDSFMINMVNGLIEDEYKYLENVANKVVEALSREVPDWGSKNLDDGIFYDDYHDLK